MNERETHTIPAGQVPREATFVSEMLLDMMEPLDPFVRIAALMQVVGVTLCKVSPTIESARLNLESIRSSVLAQLPKAFDAVNREAVPDEAAPSDTQKGI